MYMSDAKEDNRIRNLELETKARTSGVIRRFLWLVKRRSPFCGGNICLAYPDLDSRTAHSGTFLA